ncbi:adenylate/guanylate cyclase domain-containing protein [bacterium]|nr:adenylate/guanylate cyclase domain-containing protein [bacterium]
MPLQRRFWAIVFAFIGLLAATLFNGLGVAEFTEMFFKRSVFRIRGVQETDSRIVIAGIDDVSINMLEGAGIYYPFPRTVHAELIRKLTDAGAKIVVFDILFSTEPWDISEDEALRDAIIYARERGTTVILSEAIGLGTVAVGLRGDIGSLEDSTDTILEANPVTAIVNTAPKLSYKEKEMAIVPFGGTNHYSQATQVYRLLLRERGEDFDSDPFAYGITEIGDTGHGDFLINYAGPDGTIPRVNFALFFPEYLEQSFANEESETVPDESQLAGEPAEEGKVLDLSRFAGAIVFVGSVAKADNDYFMTPFEEMFGVETNAQALNTLVTGRFIHVTRQHLAMALVILLALLAWAFAVNMRPLLSFVAFTIVLIAYETLIVLAFTRGNLLMPFTYPSVTFFFSFFFSLSFRVLTEEAEKRRIRLTFGRYMSPDVVKEIIDRPELADLGGDEREVALLFSDIRNYSTLSEKANPRQTVEFLNRFLTEVSDVIMSNGGFVDKFMGDGVMAIFGAPVPRENPSEDALRAALQIAELVVDRMDDIVHGLPVPHFRVGVGIHYGTVVMGNVGSSRRMDYTCIGDVVNVASRLESETKTFGTAILISREVHEHIGEGFTCEHLGAVKVKGRAEPVEVYKVLHPRGDEVTDIRDYLPGGSKFPGGATPGEAPSGP